MLATPLAPGALWVVAGVVAIGVAGGLGLANAAGAGVTWALLLAPMAGALLFAAALVPAFALLPPGAAVPVTALGGVALLALLLRRGAWRWARPSLGARVAVAGVFAVAVVAAAGTSRMTYAVLLATPFPPVLGEPSSGDMGLHALRVAMVAREGIPPPGPLDPDYSLPYRYLFHVLAAALVATGSADTAIATAAAAGLVAGALVAGGAALGWRLAGSWPVALAAGALAVAYGPSYWLATALRALADGSRPGLRYFGGLMGGEWSMSPFTPAFPSVLSANGSSPAVPVAVLAWLFVLCCFSAMVAAAAHRRAAAVFLGVSLAILVFAADFFAPLALLALLAGGAFDWRRRRLPWQPAVLAVYAAVAAGLLLFGTARQLAGTGAAAGLHLEWNATVAVTPVYGGNHALLAGGAPRSFPNWVAIHDWGVLFWPGLALAVVGAVRTRDATLLAGAAGTLGAALFWHAFTVAYASGTPSDPRVQMYRYASLATASLGPLLPIAIYACLRRRCTDGARHRSSAGALSRLAATVPSAGRAAVLAIASAIAGGGGALLLVGYLGLQPSSPPAVMGDVALAKRLAAELSGTRVNRVAVLGGPESFGAMYEPHGGYLPLWWALGQAAVPVGWDFGYPERYQPLYRRVVSDLDPAAAAQLGLTHVALAPAQVAENRRPAVDSFLARCGAELLGEWGDAATPEGRRLYRVDARACGA